MFARRRNTRPRRLDVSYQKLIALAVGMALSHGAQADASYEETMQVTGGTMKQIMGMTGQFSPSASNSMQKANSTITAVQGNRMARVAANQTTIFDLDKGTVTRIDSKKKQYSVITFEEMQKMAAEQAAKMQQLMEEHKGELASGPEMPKELSEIPTTFDVKTESTGASKTIEGTPAHEVLLTENMSFHDPKGGNDTVTYYYKNDVWLANSEPPGWKEIEDFNKRLAAKMAFNAANNPFALITATRPGLADGLKKLGEEQKKQQGVAVMVVQQLGGHAEGDSVVAAGNTAVGGTGTSMANEVVSNTASEAAQKEASQINDSGKLGVLSSSLLSSAVSVFQRHSQDLTKAATSSATSSTSATSATSQPGKPTSVDKVMMETTVVMSNFSTEKVPASTFEVPAGYAKIDWAGPTGKTH
jgi:hypothetical protein